MADIYWAVYPSGDADPTASEVVAGTRTPAFTATANETSPTSDGAFAGSTISGLTAGAKYKLAAAWDDGTDTSAVEVSSQFATEVTTISNPEVDVVSSTTIDVAITFAAQSQGQIRFVVYPATQSDPSLADVIDNTVANTASMGYWSTNFPSGRWEYGGNPLTGLTAGTDYKLAVAHYATFSNDGGDNLVISSSFNTSTGIDATIGIQALQNQFAPILGSRLNGYIQ